jgi:hypothetical protein
LGMLSRIIGAILSGAGAFILFYGMNDPNMAWVWFFIGLLVISIGFNMMAAGREPKAPKPPPPTITEVRCNSPNCDFKDIRDFQKGDYVLKPLDTKCPKCGSMMTIEGVYIVKEEEEKEKSDI